MARAGGVHHGPWRRPAVGLCDGSAPIVLGPPGANQPHSVHQVAAITTSVLDLPGLVAILDLGQEEK